LKRLFVFAVVLGLLVVMVSSVSVVGASASQAVSGAWQIGSIISSSVQPVGGNCIIELVDTANFQGDFVGTSTQHTRIMHLGPCDQPAVEVFQSQGTFEGTVAGVSGTFDLLLQGGADAQGNVQGQLVILNGTEGLANLHGAVTLTGPLFPGGTYSGDIHFES
jgi:hypothetical protein